MAKAKTTKAKQSTKAKAKKPAKVKKPAATKVKKPATTKAKKPATAKKPTAKPASTWHAWTGRPDERAVRDHIEAFFQALHTGDLTGAFTLCPIYTYRTPLLVAASDAKAVKAAVAYMKEILAGYDYVDSDDKAWLTHVTPPSRVDYAQLNLAMPEDTGDVLANVFVDDQVTDATAIFALVQQDARWVLAFKLFKVM